MRESKHFKKLKECCNSIDILLNTNSASCLAEQIADGNDISILKLCNIINKTTERNDPKLTQAAIETKNALLCFEGYKKLSELLSEKKDETENDISLEELINSLNKLIGLKKVKQKVKDLIAFQRIQILRKEKGLRSPQGTLHIAFTGNPGTGKTTVARIIGKIYKKLGLLSKGHFTEVSRTDLIAGYQGQTALKVKAVIEKSKGGVLFIDEAYSITENDHSDSYGRECLTELTKALEDYRKDLVVIVAGYTEPMTQFFASNPGLKSRFNSFIEFEDYDADELLKIMLCMAENEDYIFTENAENTLSQRLKAIVENKTKDFSNARFSRNIFEEMTMNQARRLSEIKEPSTNDLKQLTHEDIPLNL